MGSALAPLSCGSHRIIQVDAAHWWWLRRDPPPPPHMIVKCFGCTTIHNKALYKCINHECIIHNSKVWSDNFFFLYIYIYIYIYVLPDCIYLIKITVKTNILKYIYNCKQLFSVLIYFKLSFINKVREEHVRYSA